MSVVSGQTGAAAGARSDGGGERSAGGKRLLPTSSHWLWLAPVLSGLLLNAAFPPLDRPSLAWVALVPLLLSLGDPRPWVAAARGWLFGAVFFGLLLSWISVFGAVAWLALVLCLTPGTALFGLAARPLLRSSGWRLTFGVPALWVAIEWLRMQGSLAFAWGQLGISQAHALPALQMAAWGGVWLVSFAVALTNAALSALLLQWAARRTDAAATRAGGGLDPLARRGPGRWAPALGLALVAALLGLGELRLRCAASAPDGPRLRIGVVQANTRATDGFEKEFPTEVLRIHAELTHRLQRQGANLVVWPETAVPGSVPEDAWLRESIETLARQGRTALLVGTTAGTLANGAAYNSLQSVDPRGELGPRYDKVHLVPFGEFVPLRPLWPWLVSLGAPEVDMRWGGPPKPLRLPLAATPGGPTSVFVGPMICFESTFPGISRRLVREGAQVLVAATVDSWYGHTAAAEQHAAFSLLRAVETGRYLARASATGVSMGIDPYGREQWRTGLFQRGARAWDVRPTGRLTPYTRWGDWVVWLSLGLLAAALVPRDRLRLPRRRG